MLWWFWKRRQGFIRTFVFGYLFGNQDYWYHVVHVQANGPVVLKSPVVYTHLQSVYGHLQVCCSFLKWIGFYKAVKPCVGVLSCTVMSEPLQPQGLQPGMLQSRILEWVTISSSRGSSWLRNWTRVPCIAGRLFTTEPPGRPIDLTKCWEIHNIGNQ